VSGLKVNSIYLLANRSHLLANTIHLLANTIRLLAKTIYLQVNTIEQVVKSFVDWDGKGRASSAPSRHLVPVLRAGHGPVISHRLSLRQKNTSDWQKQTGIVGVHITQDRKSVG
jgi:hypothetical protein